ncbi:MAG: hypothetical protein SF069_06440 [Phycisphaerae bacterium]|nr:hypothetical protein [Phycisphaerae bacterium]
MCDHSISDPWQWHIDHNRSASCKPIDALSGIVSAVAENVHGSAQEHEVTLVVPNTLDAERQDAMLRALRSRGIDPFLLWRPVAAGLSWIHRFDRTLHLALKDADRPIGVLWTIHLGLDAFELACVELHVREFGGKRIVLPARRLPVLKSLYGEGLFWAECLASSATSSYDAEGGAAWNLLWTTPWLERVLRTARSPAANGSILPTSGTLHDGLSMLRQTDPCGAFFEGLLRRGTTGIAHNAHQTRLTRLRSTWAPLSGPFTQPKLAAFHPKSQLGLWLSEVQAAVAPGLPVLGYVGTGSFAGVSVGRTSLAGAVARELLGEQSTSHAIVEGVGSEVGELLAEGAALCAGRRTRGIPPYLDTLPQLESLIVRAGEPAWEDLLGARNRYVNGGEPWKYVPPNLGLYVQREERHLKLSVWREGHDTVREAIVPFPMAVSKDTPVGLAIQMSPGQGSARIEVTPADADVFSGRRAYLDWARAEDIKKTRQQVLDEEPRTNPPLEPRGASLLAWRGAYWRTSAGGSSGAVRSFLAHVERMGAASLAEQLYKIRTMFLWWTDPEEKSKTPPNHCTAVSSDGGVHEGASDAALLPQFLQALDGRLEGIRSGEAFEEIVRTLGYCSANTPMLISLLRRAIESRGSIQDFHLVAIGNCLRQPADINRFMQVTVGLLTSGRLPWRNEWLKALARMLQYRENATQMMDSDECRTVSEYCTTIMREQIENGRAKLLYRSASLCIVYLLRRRKYDPTYLDPTEALAKSIKQLFQSAIERHRRGRLEVIGGIVDLPLLTQMMIDYIDRRGRGRLMGLAIVD